MTHKRRSIISLSLVLSLFFATLFIGSTSVSASTSTTLFVSTAGNDANDCLSPATACATINGAIGKASDGDLIVVGSGTFIENINVNKSLFISCVNAGVSAGWDAGTRESETVIRGEADIRSIGTVIDGCMFVRPNVATNLAPKLIESIGVSGEITIRNSIFDLTVFGTASTTGCGSGTWGTAAWRIYSNEFKNQRYASSTCSPSSTNLYNSRAIWAENALPIIVDGNYFNNTAQSIYLTGVQPSGSIVSNNVFANGAAGPFIGVPVGVRIVGNTFGPGSTYVGGIYLSSTPGTIIENNLFTSGNSYAVWADTAHSGTIIRNNAILGKYWPGTSYFNNRTIFNLGAAEFNAERNWWGTTNPSEIRAVTYESPGTVRIENWLTDFEDLYSDGRPGFWPVQRGLRIPTPVGTDVDVLFTGFSNDLSVLVAFNNIAVAGETTVKSYFQDFPQAPQGFKVGNPATYYQITTTSTFNGLIEVCFDFLPSSFAENEVPKILHWRDAQQKWEEVDTIIEGSTACGRVASFSPFALGVLDAPEILPIRQVIIPPSAPERVSIQVRNRNSIRVSWTAPRTSGTGKILRYEIYRNGLKIGSVSASTRQYLDKGLDARTSYSYRIVAIGDQASSVKSRATISIFPRR